MIRVHQIVIVEGKYDRHTLSNFLDASIIETGGFAIFKNKPLTDTLKKLAPQRGLIILTDSDRAGFAIRNYLCGTIDNRYITHVYIPDIYGKERRKKAPSKEGLLGVEGMSEAIIAEAFRKAGVTADQTPSKAFLTKTDLYQSGLSGGPESVRLRNAIKKELNLPGNLSTNRLLEILNIMLTKQEYLNLVSKIKEEIETHV